MIRAALWLKAGADHGHRPHPTTGATIGMGRPVRH